MEFLTCKNKMLLITRVISARYEPHIENNSGISNDGLIGNECQHIQRVLLTQTITEKPENY